MLEKVLNMFELRDQFDALASAEHLPWSKPHPQVYLNCAAALGSTRSAASRWRIRSTA
jgi:sugar-phosphatase